MPDSGRMEEYALRKLIATLLCVMLAACSLPVSADEPASFVLYGFDETANHKWSENRFFAEAEALTGIHFEINQYTDYASWQQMKASLLQSTSCPDVLFKAQLTDQEIQQYYADGLILDLKPFLTAENAPNLTALLEEHPEWLREITLPDGSIPALPQINVLQNNNAMWINKSWLDLLRLSMPATAEELTQVLRAFKAGDPNKNGKADEIPYTFQSLWDLKFLSHAFGFICDDYGLSADDSGIFTYQLSTEKARAFIEWLHQLWAERLIDRNGFATNDTLRAVTDSNASIPYGIVTGPTPLTLIPSSALGQYTLLEPLTCDGQQLYRDLTGDVVRGTFAVTAACKDPALMVRWADTFYGDAGTRLAQAGKEGVDYVFNRDGSWNWLPDSTTVTNDVIPNSTLIDGAEMPCYVSENFQLAYEEESAHQALLYLQQLKSLSRKPAPHVYLTAAQQQEVTQLQSVLGPWAETQLTWFITGDQPLNDDTWNAFVQGTAERGAGKLANIFTTAMNESMKTEGSAE